MEQKRGWRRLGIQQLQREFHCVFLIPLLRAVCPHNSGASVILDCGCWIVDVGLWMFGC